VRDIKLCSEPPVIEPPAPAFICLKKLQTQTIGISNDVTEIFPLGNMIT